MASLISQVDFKVNNHSSVFQENISGYALSPKSWGLSSATSCSSSLRYEGYEYVLCNPYFSGSQPAGCDNTKFAIMNSPATGAGDFSGKRAWITNEYEKGNNY